MKKLLKSILKLLVPRSIQNKIYTVLANLDTALHDISRLYQLSWYRAQKYACEDKYPEILADWYREHTGKELDLENPRTFDEKAPWLKLGDSTTLKTRLSDKLLVRDWVKEKVRYA